MLGKSQVPSRQDAKTRRRGRPRAPEGFGISEHSGEKIFSARASLTGLTASLVEEQLSRRQMYSQRKSRGATSFNHVFSGPVNKRVCPKTDSPKELSVDLIM